MDKTVGHPASLGDVDLSEVYGEKYYGNQVADSLSSAHIVLTRLWEYLKPTSVLDVGCGRGAWLKACHALGCETLFGLDGDWNSQSVMIDSAIRFRSVDLNKPFSVPIKADLAISLEVAEHLEPSSSSQFVECLAKASDTVLFGAACPGQGGANHLNERRPSYWAGLFRKQGHVVFDLFRPVLWGNDEISVWYRQNAFLYCREGGDSYRAIRSAGCSELTETSFMDCIHPVLYELRLGTGIGFTEHVKSLAPSLCRAVQKRMRTAKTTRWATRPAP
jgi:hypothetical protein